MPFLAANPVPCTKCHATIPKGAPISWTRGKGATPGVYHVICPVEVPAGVTFTMDPMTALAAAPADHVLVEGLPTWDEPTLVEDDELVLVEDEPEPVPGTRAWFATATMADREYQLGLSLGESVTRRQFHRAVARYSKLLTDRDTSRLRRYARGLWDGAIASRPEKDYTRADYWAQPQLFPEPSIADQHGADTLAMRALVAEWSRVPA